MSKKTRRSFTKEYKVEVVELIRKSGKTVGAVCRDLDLTETAVRHIQRSLVRHDPFLFTVHSSRIKPLPLRRR